MRVLDSRYASDSLWNLTQREGKGEGEGEIEAETRAKRQTETETHRQTLTLPALPCFQKAHSLFCCDVWVENYCDKVRHKNNRQLSVPGLVCCCRCFLIKRAREGTSAGTLVLQVTRLTIFHSYRTQWVTIISTAVEVKDVF